VTPLSVVEPVVPPEPVLAPVVPPPPVVGPVLEVALVAVAVSTPPSLLPVEPAAVVALALAPELELAVVLGAVVALEVALVAPALVEPVPLPAAAATGPSLPAWPSAEGSLQPTSWTNVRQAGKKALKRESIVASEAPAGRILREHDAVQVWERIFQKK